MSWRQLENEDFTVVTQKPFWFDAILHFSLSTIASVKVLLTWECKGIPRDAFEPKIGRQTLSI